MDRSYTTTHHPQSRRHETSLLHPSDPQHSTTGPPRPVFHRTGNIQLRRKGGGNYTRTPSGVSKTPQDFQQTRIPTTTRSHHLGPCHRTPSWCPYHITRTTSAPNSSRDRRGKEVCRQTPKEGNHSTVLESLCHQLLLCKKERWEVVARTRLPTTQQMDKEELQYIPINSPSHRLTEQKYFIYQI